MEIYHVIKCGDSIPVQVKDDEHLARIVSDVGAAAVIRPDGRSVERAREDERIAAEEAAAEAEAEAARIAAEEEARRQAEGQ